MINEYDVFKYYSLIKSHFTTDYDIEKYNWKSSKISVDRFKKSKNVEALCRYILNRYSDEKNLKMYLIANISKNVNIDLFLLHKEKDTCDKIFFEYKKRQESLGYEFRKDITKLFESTTNIKEIFKCNDVGGFYGNWPEALIQCKEELINVETLIILDDILDLFSKWDQKLNDDWISYRKYLIKYKTFIRYDKSQMKKTLRECIDKFTMMYIGK